MMKRSPINQKYFAIAGFALLAIWMFLYVAFEVTEGGSGDRAWMIADQGVISSVTGFRSDFFTALMISFTYLGSTLSVSIMAIVALLISHFKRLYSERRILFYSGLSSLLLIRGVKLFFGRVRPDPQTWLAPAGGLSFPSGHATGSFAVLGALFFVLGRSCERTHQRFVIWSLGAAIIFLIGFSRIYLGVHFPTDVLGGFLLGLSILLLSLAADAYREHGQAQRTHL